MTSSVMSVRSSGTSELLIAVKFELMRTTLHSNLLTVYSINFISFQYRKHFQLHRRVPIILSLEAHFSVYSFSISIISIRS